jgi:hypothetical protein
MERNPLTFFPVILVFMAGKLFLFLERKRDLSTPKQDPEIPIDF